MTDEMISRDKVANTLAKAIATLAEKAETESQSTYARDYAEAAERLANAYVSLKGGGAWRAV